MTNLQWFESYLGGRGQQCLVHGFTSSRSQVPSGVPQGSILGPLLFLVYVNDLPPVIQNRIALFADDSKCSSVIESLQDCESLQKGLESLHGWSDDWHLKFNASKCEVLTVIVCFMSGTGPEFGVSLGPPSCYLCVLKGCVHLSVLSCHIS